MIESSVEQGAAPRAPKGDQAYPPWKERALRGLALWGDPLGRQIEHLGRGKYSVPSCSEQGKTYTVGLAPFGGEESCSCPARERPCKHLVAATIHRAKRSAASRRKAEERRREREASRVTLGGLGVS